MNQCNPHLMLQLILQRIITLCLSVGALLTTTSISAAPIVPADNVKAAYIYQFTNFVSWPKTSKPTKETFTICAFGQGAIYDKLAPLNLRQEKMRLIKVRRPKTISDTNNCNILYIEKSEQHQLTDILIQIHKKPILTVSSIPNFTENGGIIGFIIIDNKVRLEINRTAAHHASVKLSAKLLEVANVVRNGASKDGQP